MKKPRLIRTSGLRRLLMLARLQLCRSTVGLSIVLTMAPNPARAADPDQPATSYLRTTFTVEDGLNSNVVNAILQTRDGFLWIGTDAGLDRFDGRQFTPFYFRGPKSTPQGIVRSLAEGPNGDLWIATNAGLFRIPKRALDQCDRSLAVLYHPGTGISDEVNALHFTRDGTLWVATSGGLYRFVDNQFNSVIPNAVISEIEESLDGHLLIVGSQGFVELDGTRVMEHPDLAHQLDTGPGSLFQVVQDSKGVVWFSTTSAGLVRRVNGSIERLHAWDKGLTVYWVHEDPQGNLWVYGTSGLFRVSGMRLEPEVPNIQIRSMSTDREGNLWVGTNGEGLMRFKDRPIRVFTTADGLPNNIPMTVLYRRDGSLWVGNNCGGLSVFNGERFKTYDEKDGLSNSCVWALAEGKNGELWVGTWGGGLYRFADGHFEQFTSRKGLPDVVVRAITIAQDGSLWIATQSGLSHMVNGQFHNYSTTDGLSSNRVVGVYQDRHGIIWVGTSRGINRMIGDRFAPALSPNQIFDPRYISFAEGSSGDLYALSAPKGVDRIEGNQLVEVNHDLDLLSMVTSPSGESWFTGGNGIFRFSAEAFRQNQAGSETPLDYAWFDKADGMTSTQCSLGAPNMALAPDGKLWVATVQGLAMLDLPHLSFDSAKPVTFVEDVTVGRTSQPAGRELVLAPGTHHVELHFDSIDLSSPEKIRFQYRMDDVDPVWLDADNSLTAVYNNIPVGTHAFRIRANNSAGVWDRSGISFPVTQKPHFYQTTWFRLVAVTAFVVILIGAYRFRLHQIRAEMNARLDERVLERTRIARELHDSLLQGFQGMMFRLQAVRDMLPDPSEAAQALDVALERGDQAIAEGRDTVTDLRQSVMGDGDMAGALTALGEELAAQSDNCAVPCVRVLVEGEQRELNPMLCDEVYRIAREAMRNAFRHARAQKIEAEIKYGDPEFLLHVRDDGSGIDPAVGNEGARAGHWGLPGMRERAKRFGGKLEVWSERGAGTEIELSVPAAIAYGKSDARPKFWFLRKKTEQTDGQQP